MISMTQTFTWNIDNSVSNENYKKEANSLISQLRLDFASITEAIANTPAGDSAIKD